MRVGRTEFGCAGSSVGPSAPPIARIGETLIRLTDLMAHRGPDGAGHSLFDTADGRFQIGLGHRRLSIIDIGGGHQPMSSDDGRFTLTFNGEIYNYRRAPRRSSWRLAIAFARTQTPRS